MTQIQDYLEIEFDKSARILHLSYKAKIHATTRQHLDAKFTALRSILNKYAEHGRIYLIIDMSNFIMDPELKSSYAAHAKAISEQYIMPRGIARYGYQITRITVRAGYRDLGESPNIFGTREEAYDYIYALIKEQRKCTEAASTRAVP